MKYWLDYAKEKILIADGAMGTELMRLGLPAGAGIDRANLTHPGLVVEAHRRYLKAGAKLIETNTFGAGRMRLAQAGLAAEMEAINRAGVKLAREAAAGNDALIAGAVGPLGTALAPLGELRPEEAGELFTGQLQLLAEEKVDLILLETFADLAELLIAARAALAFGLPVLASLAFDAEGYTIAGISAHNAAAALAGLPLAGIGANCGAGPEGLAQAALALGQNMGADQLLCLMPNAGLPQRVHGRVVFRTEPAYFAASAQRLREMGANIIGGCCGSSPEHIAALAGELAGWEAKPRPARVFAEPAAPAPAAMRSSIMLNKLKQGKFVCTVELDPPKGPDPAALIQAAQALKHAGADAVDIADGPMARVRMGSIALAHRLEEETGLEALLHLTCRDRNLIGLQADLLGASALGLKNILALTGDPPQVGDHPQAKAVFDVNATGLVRIMAGLNQGRDLAGNTLGRATDFAIGVAVNPGAEDMEAELAKLQAKLEAGADFCLTQPVFAPELVESCLRELQRRGVPVLLGLWPLRSLRQTEYLAHEVPGIRIPSRVLAEMRACPPEKQAEVGMMVARDTLAALRPLCAGVCLMPGGGLEAALALVRMARA